MIASESRATIERLRAVFVLPSGDSRVGDAHARLDRIMRTTLAPACARRLAPLLVNDGAVWFIRRLDVDATVDLSLPDEEAIVELWAERIAGRIGRLLGEGIGGDDVVRFADRAAYVARFFEDIVAGRAWDQWYFAPFDSLRALPTSAALREVLLRDPEPADAALTQLARGGRLGSVLRAMTEADLRAVLDARLPAGTGAVATTTAVEAVLGVWAEAAIEASPFGIAGARNTLRLYVGIRARTGAAAPVHELRAAIELLLQFAGSAFSSRIGSTSGRTEQQLDPRKAEPSEAATCPVEEEPISRALALAPDLPRSVVERALRVIAGWPAGSAARPTGIGAHCGTSIVGWPAESPAPLADERARATRPTIEHGPGERYAPSARLPDAVEHPSDASAARSLDGHAATFEDRTTSPADVRPPSPIPLATRTISSPFGGVFLLLPSLFDLGVHQVMARARYPTGEGLDAAAALRLVIVLKCLGDGRALEAMVDPVVGLAAGLERPASVEALRGFASGTKAREHEEVLRDLVSVVVTRSLVIDGGCLVVECGRHGGRRFLGVRDLLSGTWVFAEPLRDHREAARVLARGLRLLRGAGIKAGHRVLAPSAATYFDAAECAALGIHARPETLPDDLRGSFAHFLARVSATQRELDHFSLRSLRGQQRLDLTWTLVAHAVLRAFARRLTGFASSSPEFLLENFLAGESLVRVGERAIDVELSQPPLALVLRLAGVDGLTYRIPWLGDRQVVLSFRQG